MELQVAYLGAEVPLDDRADEILDLLGETRIPLGRRRLVLRRRCSCRQNSHFVAQATEMVSEVWYSPKKENVISAARRDK